MFSYLVLVLGIFLVIIALTLLFAPDALTKINDFMNKNVFLTSPFICIDM